MVKIDVMKDKIVFDGHAEYDYNGRDIVCSAISSTLITSVNAIFEFDGEEASILFKHEPQNNNYASITVIAETNYNKKILKNMIDMLEDMQKQYPNNIKVERKEV